MTPRDRPSSIPQPTLDTLANVVQQALDELAAQPPASRFARVAEVLRQLPETPDPSPLDDERD